MILRERGSSPEAFTFREPFPPPDVSGPVAPDERWFCPA
jgi:hypothetical protein